MSDPSEELLLLDPSVFLGDEGFGWLEDLPHDERRRFVVSSTFFNQVAGKAEYTAADEELWGPLPGEGARRQLLELIADLTIFSENDVPRDLPPLVGEIAIRLAQMGSQVAVEEWFYLQSNSWLGAGSRKVLDHFKRAGAKVVEVSGNAVEDLTWLAAGQRPGPPGTLTPELIRKAGINVVVVGGMTTAGFLMPVLTIPVGIVALIINPLLGPAQPPPAT